MFYNSKERKIWSGKFNWDWNSYKRFMEDFPRWNKIVKAEAHKRMESDVEIFQEYLQKQD